ncbi:MAG: hypothetical protein HN348_15300 [Proteobacteria bacterium]|nr:hypothetical protein [Pseudomonadota bacterium]
MSTQLAFALAVLGQASAQSPFFTEVVELPDEVIGLGPVTEVGLLCFGNEQSWLLHTDQPPTMFPFVAVDGVVLDTDDDGEKELLLCGDRGLHAFELDGTAGDTVSGELCHQVTLVHHNPPTVAAVGNTARMYLRQNKTLQEVTRLEGEWGEKPLIAVHEARVGLAGVGRAGVVEWTVEGTRHIETGGPLGGLTGRGNGWVWSLPVQGLVASETDSQTVFPSPQQIIAHELEGGAKELVIVHTTPSMVGVIPESGLERAFPLDVPPSGLAVGDLDGDGCAEIVVGQGSRLKILRRSCTLPPSADPDSFIEPESTPIPPLGKHPQAQLEKGRLFGFLGIPTFLTGNGTMSSGKNVAQRTTTAGAGVAWGGPMRPAWWAIGFSPAVYMANERGGPRTRSFFGLETAPTFAWGLDKGGGIQLFNLSAGATFGSPHLRAGPYATIGIFNVGAGLRFVLTPWETRKAKLFGFESRFTWFWPRTAQLSLLAVQTFPRRRQKKTNTGVASKEQGLFFCRRLAGAIGGSVGASYIVGEEETQWSGSFAVSVQCEAGKGSLSPFYAINTAPLFHYQFPNWAMPNEHPIHHMGSLSTGVMVGSDSFRAGPFVTGGVWTLGGGLRAVITPFAVKNTHHGLELRAKYLYPSMAAAEGMLLYHTWMDPRKKTKE